ncbi:hypothetical protein BOTBODRAFT_164140 [Botryobasidium botryosum FD-172 SS1]|uniref:Protein kinase domain-containing protein n=1 Tax=Botryobasidium botryosum (strain FD-172 SS1) TaxID=930990 RepID=A0A067M3Q9_BOTB1|nr:hypothetical protein BOTBODRAFT_164140 [Botryobasidium botryosum FD-172 SS1]
MVSPWMDNGDLGAYLKRSTTDGSGVNRVLLLCQIAKGLEYLHTSDPIVIHGDLKATNILISNSGDACIADFGLSETVTQTRPQFDGDRTANVNRRTNGSRETNTCRSIEYGTNNSTAWHTAGNARWQAPELLTETLQRTTCSDVFAFGRVITEVYTRDIPFPDKNNAQVVLLVVGGALPSRAEFSRHTRTGQPDLGESASAWGLMEKCCQRDPPLRPTAGEVVCLLEASLRCRDLDTRRQAPLPIHGGSTFSTPSDTGATIHTNVHLNTHEFMKPRPDLSQSPTESPDFPSSADPTLYEWEVVKVRDIPAGSGGFGDCFEGMLLGRHRVAMKCCREHIPARVAMRIAEKELKVWVRLRHPNVLPLIESVVIDSKMYLVSPWMSNGDLASYLKRNPDADCLQLLTQIATGLEYLHTSKPVVVHGDPKANNILISDSGEARLADFGLSDLLVDAFGRRDSAPVSPITNATPWEFAGNPRWQAPELLARDTYRTTSSDVFAFGRVIIEVYTRKVPFAHIPDSTSVIALVANGTMPPRPRGKDVKARTNMLCCGTPSAT